MRRRRLIAAATVLAATFAATGCRDARERRGGPLEAYTGDRQDIVSPVTAGAAVAVGVPPFVVRRELVLDRVELVGADPALRLHAARVNFLACPRCRRRPGYLGVNGFLTSVCAGPFPPPSYGPTYDVAGLRLFPHDAPSVLLYLSATAPGRHEVSDVRVHYRDARGRRWMVDVTSFRYVVDQGAHGCAKADDVVWTGGHGGLQQAVPMD